MDTPRLFTTPTIPTETSSTSSSTTLPATLPAHPPRGRATRRPHGRSARLLFAAAVVILACATLWAEPARAAGNDRNRARMKPTVESRLPSRVGQLLELSHDMALRRLRKHPSCRALFAGLGADGVEVLSQVRYTRAPHRSDSPCAGGGVAAYTDLGSESSEIWLCLEGFGGLDRYEAATTVLHEALHRAGLSEVPHDPDGLTPREIDRLVQSSCGL